MNDLFGKKQTSVFVSLPHRSAQKNTRPTKKAPTQKNSGIATVTKKNSVAVQTALPFTGTRRNTRRPGGEVSQKHRIFRAAGRGEILTLIFVIILLTVVSFGKIYLETEITKEKKAVKDGHEEINELLLEHENLKKSVTQKKNLSEIEDWARQRGMVKPDPDKIILVK